MITEIKVGDITDSVNRSDIIIGMNTNMADVQGIGLPFVGQLQGLRNLDLGSVLSFRFDEYRVLHMLICHKIGESGWQGADRYVRYGLDYLWQSDPMKDYSIVQIGTGRVGKRDGADPAAILTAMADSFLPVRLLILPDGRERLGFEAALQHPAVVPLHLWTPRRGEQEIQVAA